MKVSVSVVTYQQVETVRQAVESILLQKADFDFEVIIGDDASTDGTQKILREFQSLVPVPVKTILRETNAGNGGLTNVMSTLDAAEGEYIAFLDGDDYWTDRGKLQKQIDFLDAHPECVICAHRVEHLRSGGGTALSVNAPRGSGTYDVGALIARNFAPKISTVVRKSAIADLPDWYRTTTVTSADWLMNVLVGRHGRIGFIDQVMAVHRVHQASICVSYGPAKMTSDKLRAITTLRQYLPQQAKELTRLERRLLWKLRTAHFSPHAFTILKRLNELTRSRPH